uniref:Aminopeptidase n=1 Tax=Holotrichia oblita TaxID=644536 RepID=A0A977TNJ9_HOLOL|nr:aminopeptidase N-like protein [Holotrichia oblita]
METYVRVYLMFVFFGTALSYRLLESTGTALGYRLPESVIPSEYKVQITTNLGDEGGKFDFYGKVTIDVTCTSPTKNITLHSKNLRIKKENVHVYPLESKSDKHLKVTGVDHVKNDDFLIISLSEALKDGHKYKIEISFDADLEEGLAGYYKSYYTDKTGKKTWLAVTQFEPSDARRAFPCFDEPAMKAKFKVTLGRTQKYTSISNMPVIKTEPIHDKPGWEWDTFETSVPMSTYLVAFAVTDFSFEVAPKYGNNVTFRVWSRKEALNQIEFAKDIGPKALSFYEDYFDIKYPLPKQDMIALPEFSAGAMENWGLITYRETYLLYDPKQSSQYNKASVASVIAHELAHQWFGNLVTMKWWTDIWLNEGFATYMSALAVDHSFPEWKYLEEETVDNILAVFSFDSLKHSHPVSVPIGNPKEIDEIFDTISYKKGSYLLHMIANFLGQETLRKGVSHYLKIHKYSNAEKDDLWHSITDDAHRSSTLQKNLTVKTVMDSWALQTGYPLLTVKRNYGHGTVEVKQERFLRDRSQPETDPTKWWVPLSYTTESENAFNDTTARMWLPPDQDKLIIEGFPKDSDWVIFNIKASGLYRVNYDEKNWNLLIEALKSDNFKKIPILNRVLLIDNSAQLAWTGRLDYRIFFNVVGYLEQENEYLPWKAAIRSIDNLDNLLKRTAVYGDFKDYLKKIIKPIYDKIGGFQNVDEKNSRYDVLQHKVLATQIACRYRIEHCVTEAVELFKTYQTNNTKEHVPENDAIPNDLRGVVFCFSIKYGGQAEWNFLWNQYLTSNVASVKNTILKALGCTRQTWLMQRYLEWSVSNHSGIRKQDITTVFSSVIGNDVGFHISKNFIQDHVKEIYNRIKPTVGKLSHIINNLASSMITFGEYEWLKHLTDTNSEYFREIKNGVSQALETAKLNAQWHEANYNGIKEHLKEFKS